MLVRNGDWDKNTLKPGDVITAIGFRAKNGTNILRLKKIVLADGKEFPIYRSKEQGLGREVSVGE